MKYSDLHSIETQYFSSGSHYVMGRLSAQDSIKVFRIYNDSNRPQSEWVLYEIPKKKQMLPRHILAGRYYLELIRNVLRV